MGEKVIAEPKDIRNVIDDLKPKIGDIQNGPGNFGEKIGKLKELISDTLKHREEDWYKKRIIIDKFLTVSQGDNFNPIVRAERSRKATIEGPSDDWIVEKFELIKGDVAHRHEERASKIFNENDEPTSVRFSVKAIEPGGLGKTSKSSATCVVTFKLSDGGLGEIIEDEKIELTDAVGL